LRNAHIEVKGVVMLGPENPDNRRAVERFGSVPVIGVVPWLAHIDRTALLDVYDRYFDRDAFA
jgi:dethiobiotin synthetase